MAGYDPNGMAGAVVPSYQEAGADVVVDGQEQPDDPRAYGAVAPYGDGKKGGDGLAQTEKLWLFGEKKPLSVQSYGSLPVEVRPSCAAQPQPQPRAAPAAAQRHTRRAAPQRSSAPRRAAAKRARPSVRSPSPGR